jgi:thiosulfate/3-mercaptopyruvate sulfurtransferase
MRPHACNPTHAGNLSRWLLLLTAFWFLSDAFAVTLPGPLVDTKWLAENLDNVIVLDVRKDVDSFEKRPKGAGPVNPCGPGAKKKGEKPLVVAGHIPGAVLVPWKEVTGKRKVNGVEIKALLPEKEKLEKLMQKSGVSNDSTIVITSKGQAPVQTALAARLYWTLKYFGHDNVALLNGGTAQWMVDKQRVEFGKSKVDKGTYKATAEHSEMLATMEDVMRLNEGGASDEQLLDVRGKDLYLGDGPHCGCEEFPCFLNG